MENFSEEYEKNSYYFYKNVEDSIKKFNVEIVVVFEYKVDEIKEINDIWNF